MSFSLWEGAGETETSTATPSDPGTEATPSDNDKAVGHKRAKPAKEVVTTAVSTVGPEPPLVKTPTQPAFTPRPRVDFKRLREPVTGRVRGLATRRSADGTRSVSVGTFLGG